MANIIGRLTDNEVEILQVDNDPSIGPGTPAFIGSIAMWNDGTVGRVYVKTGPLNTDWDQVNTLAVAGAVLNGVGGRIPVYPSTGNTVDDVYVQNSQPVVVQHDSHLARSTPITYTIPNPGNTISSADFVLTEGSQTINGNKTFNDNVVVQGDLTVNGSLTSINSTVTTIVDPTITLNKNGPVNSSSGSGIEIEENSNIVASLTVSQDREGWDLLVPYSANTAKLSLNLLSQDREYNLPDESGKLILGNSGANNRIAFWATSNTITADSNFVWVNTLSSLGIGTGSPTANLHVVGTARITSLNLPQFVKTDANGNLINSQVDLSTGDITGVLPIANGGTNWSGPLVNNRIMWSQSGQIVEAPALNNGQLLIGNTGGAPVPANITQNGSNSVVITNGPGSIQLDTAQDIKTTASPTFNGLTLSSLTPGSVLFAGPSGVISEDNPNLFWDNANNRLGVATSVPQDTLHVNGTSRFNGRVLLSITGNNETWWGQSELTTTNGTPSNILIHTASITQSEVYLVEAHVLALRTGGTAGSPLDSASYIRTARFKNNGGTVTMRTQQSTYTSEDQASWNASLGVQSPNLIILTVNGAANNNVRWVVTYKIIRQVL